MTYLGRLIVSWQILFYSCCTELHVVINFRCTLLILTDRRFVPDVFEEDVECLKELHANVAPWILVQNVEEERQHVAL